MPHPPGDDEPVDGGGDSDATGEQRAGETDAPDPPRRPGVGDERSPGGLDRRTLIRLLVGLGIGVPILIESATLLGLVGDIVGGDEEDTATPTTTDTGVGVGDELLPETTPADTVAAAYIAADGWMFTMSVGVDNDTDRTYELRLRSVTTESGDTVEGGGESDPIPPGGSGSVTGRWDLPEGSSPASVDVVAIARNGTVTTVQRTVELGSVPVTGG